MGNYIHFQENVEEENSQDNDVSQDDTPGGGKELNYYGNNLFHGVHNTGEHINKQRVFNNGNNIIHHNVFENSNTYINDPDTTNYD